MDTIKAIEAIKIKELINILLYKYLNNKDECINMEHIREYIESNYEHKDKDDIINQYFILKEIIRNDAILNKKRHKESIMKNKRTEYYCKVCKMSYTNNYKYAHLKSKIHEKNSQDNLLPE